VAAGCCYLHVCGVVGERDHQDDGIDAELALVGGTDIDTDLELVARRSWTIGLMAKGIPILSILWERMGLNLPSSEMNEITQSLAKLVNMTNWWKTMSSTSMLLAVRAAGIASGQIGVPLSSIQAHSMITFSLNPILHFGNPER
jgi:hypothetical protein